MEKETKKIPLGGLQQGEKIISCKTPSPWAPPFITGYILGVIILLFFIFLGLIHKAFILIGFLVGIIIIYITNLYRKGHSYYVTNQRCLREFTFLSKKLKEGAYDLISNVNFDQSLSARLFDYGNVTCQMASGEPVVFLGVKKPASFKSSVVTAKQAYLEKPQRTIQVRDETKPESEAMKYCHECGSKLEGNPRYCPSCGSRLR